MRQELVDEMCKASVDDIIAVIGFEFGDDKKTELLLGLVSDMTFSEHENQGVLSLGYGE